MEENKTILTDYFNTNDSFFIPIVEEELFFSLHSEDVYTAYLKMRMDKIYRKKKLDEIDGLIMNLNYFNEHRKEILKRRRESNLKAKKYQFAAFNNYVVTEQNKTLLKMLQDYFDNSYKNVSLGFGVYIWGTPGTGKTHALYTLANEFVKHDICEIYYTSFVELFDLLRKNFTDINAQEELKDRLKKVEILFLDDIGAEHIKKDSEWYQGIIYEIINYRYEHEKPVICSSNSSRANLVKEQNYEERVVQRLMEMCPYQFEFNGDDVMRITRAKQKRVAGEKFVDELYNSTENQFALIQPPAWASDFYVFEEEYYVENSHEPIISREDFAVVQKILAEKRSKYCAGQNGKRLYPLSGKIVCGECGKTFKRKTCAKGTNYENIKWACLYKETKGKTACSSHDIKDDVITELLIQAYNESLGYKTYGNEVDAERLKALLQTERELRALRVKGYITETIYREKSIAILEEIRGLEETIKTAINKKIDMSRYKESAVLNEEMADFLIRAVVKEWTVTFEFKNGCKITKNYTNGRSGNVNGKLCKSKTEN